MQTKGLQRYKFLRNLRYTIGTIYADACDIFADANVNLYHIEFAKQTYRFCETKISRERSEHIAKKLTESEFHPPFFCYDLCGTNISAKRKMQSGKRKKTK